MSKINLMKHIIYQRVRNKLLLAYQTRFKLRITLTNDQLELFNRFNNGNEVEGKLKKGGYINLGNKRKACVIIDSRDEETDKILSR